MPNPLSYIPQMNTRTTTQIMVRLSHFPPDEHTDLDSDHGEPSDNFLLAFAVSPLQHLLAASCSQKGPQRSTLAHSRTIHATSVFKCVTARGFLSVRTAHALPAKQAKRPIRRVLLQSLPKRLENVYRYLYDAVQELSTHAPIVTKL